MRQVTQNQIIGLLLPTPQGGGTERSMVNLAQGLFALGFQVNLILDGQSPDCPLKLPSGIEVVWLGAKRGLPKVLALAGYIRRKHPLALIVSNYGHGLRYSLLAKWIAFADTRIVLGVHINISSYLKEVNKGARIWKRLLRILYYRGLWRLVDAYVAVSKGVAKDLIQAIGIEATKVHTIYNAVVTPELFRMMDEPVSHPFFNLQDTKKILGAGRLTPQKDFATLIRAFAIVRKLRRARLLILGEGEQRRELEELVKKMGLQEEVSLPGWVDNPYAYMRRADVFVLSSKWEGFGLVLVEAMACGTPVVATDCPSGPREILNGGRYGKLVPVGDEEQLAQAIVETLDNPPDRVLLKERAMEFSIERTARQYSRLFESILTK